MLSPEGQEKLNKRARRTIANARAVGLVKKRYRRNGGHATLCPPYKPTNL